MQTIVFYSRYLAKIAELGFSFRMAMFLFPFFNEESEWSQHQSPIFVPLGKFRHEEALDAAKAPT